MAGLKISTIITVRTMPGKKCPAVLGNNSLCYQDLGWTAGRLILSMTAYLLAYWAYLSSSLTDSLDWGKAAFLALSTFMPHLI